MIGNETKIKGNVKNVKTEESININNIKRFMLSKEPVNNNETEMKTII